MPEFIYDTDASLSNGTTVFSDLPTLLAAIATNNGGSSDLTGAGRHIIRLRCSNGQACDEQLNFDGLISTETDDIKIIAEFSNGNPFVITDPVGTTNGNLIGLNDSYTELTSEGFGAAIAMARAGETTERAFISNYKAGNKVNGWILHGLGSTAVAGVYSTAQTTFENMLIIGCQRQFYGAARCHGETTLNKSTVYDCLSIRACGDLTNSLVLRTDLNSFHNDGLGAASDNNAFDLDQSLVKYVSTQADANSFFGIAENKETVPHVIGGVALKSKSILSGVASDGGAVGAFGLALSPVLNISSAITRGATFSGQLTGHRAGVNAEIYIREKNGDGTEYQAALNSYNDFSFEATAPNSATMPAIASAEVRLVPIISE